MPLNDNLKYSVKKVCRNFRGNKMLNEILEDFRILDFKLLEALSVIKDEKKKEAITVTRERLVQASSYYASHVCS